MAIPRINVFPGRNSAVLKNPSSVSGLEHWGSVERDGLCECVRDECTRIFGMAPPQIQDAFAAGIDIPLYAVPKTGSVAALRYSNASRLQIKPGAQQGTLELLGFEPPTLDGLLVEVGRGDALEPLRQPVGHECLHLASMFAMHAYQLAPWEATVGRLEKDVYGSRPGTTSDLPWDPARFASTTGVAPAEFSHIDFQNTAYEAMYLSTSVALDGIRADQVWKIWAALTEQTRRTGVLPKMLDIRAAFRAEAQADGDAAMLKPGFTEIRPGLQHMVFPTVDGRARVYNFTVTQNPVPRNWLAPGRNDTRHTCQGVRAGPFAEKLYDNAGSHLATGSITLDQRVDLDHTMLKAGVAAAPGGAQWLGRMGDRIDVVIPGLPDVVIEKQP